MSRLQSPLKAEEPGGTNLPAKPSWESCGGLSYQNRLAIKERAVTDAKDYLEELGSAINATLRLKMINSDGIILGRKQLKDWVADKNAAVQEHLDYKLLVGVAGPTGAGKTSLLNALLEEQEFLPSSCEQAATSVVCQISWNRDVRPGYAYRAEIDFHDYNDVEKIIEELFQAFELRREVSLSQYENEEARIRDSAFAQSSIDNAMSKIHAVWGPELDTEALEHMKAVDLMESNKDVVALLGTTKHLNHSEASELSRTFLEKLAVTMIVAPIIRAADEKTARSLLSDYQELQLQMDGRYHRKGFCFVLSKTDDMSIEAFLKRSQDVQSNEQAIQDQGTIKQLDKDVEALKKEVKAEKKTQMKLRKDFEKASKAVKVMNSRIQKASSKNKPHAKLELELHLLEKTKSMALETLHNRSQSKRSGKKPSKIRKAKEAERTNLRNRLAFTCTTIRNKSVKARIRNDFRLRQKKFRTRQAKSPANSDIADIDVLPVSSMAFWGVRRPKSDQGTIPGFPREIYTGIPQTKQWLLEATAGHREKHLDVILNRYNGLLKWVQQWSKERDMQSTIKFIKIDVEETLRKTHERSHEAILSRNGGSYWSRGSAPQEYNWIRDLIIPVLRVIAQDWDQKVNIEIPGLSVNIMKRVDAEWKDYMDTLELQLNHGKLEELIDMALETLSAQLRFSKGNISTGFDSISQRTTSAVERQLSALFETILPPEKKITAAQDRKTRLQKDVKMLVIKWETSWNMVARECKMGDIGQLQFPEVYDEHTTHNSEASDSAASGDDWGDMDMDAWESESD
ncbi:hypothetical protein ACHAQA_005728 [Verticillium albo-atrum]